MNRRTFGKLCALLGVSIATAKYAPAILLPDASYRVEVQPSAPGEDWWLVQAGFVSLKAGGSVLGMKDGKVALSFPMTARNVYVSWDTLDPSGGYSAGVPSPIQLPMSWVGKDCIVHATCVRDYGGGGIKTYDQLVDMSTQGKGYERFVYALGEESEIEMMIGGG